MKLQTSFFDWTVLKKDLLRFAPVWAVYLIGGMLVQSTMLGNLPYYISRNLGSSTALMAFVNCGYGIVAALLLFGDLFNSRLCNALHAMPLRRENWFLTHFAAGILFSLLPNLVLTLLFMVQMGSLWYTAFVWLGGTMLGYLFFFGLATLAVMGTGTRFGALTVYGLVNFVALEVYWVIYELILPLLYGVKLPTDDFVLFSPVVHLVSNGGKFFTLEHACPMDSICRRTYGDYRDCAYVIKSFGDCWGYLFVIAALGLAFAVIALLLYRRRALECAGDFAAIRPVKWIVTICGSIGCGMVFRVFGMDHDGMELVFLFVGIAVGFFLLQMILQRKIKVFGKKNWISLLALMLAVVLLLILGVVDILGIEKRIPDTDRVEKVVVVEGNCSLNYLQRLENADLSGFVTLRDPESIDRIRGIHKELVEYPQYAERYRYITLCYYLKNGVTVLRSYRVPYGSDLFRQISGFLNGGEYIFGVSHVDEILNGSPALEFKGTLLAESDTITLLKYLWSDAEAGRLGNEYVVHSDNCRGTWLWLRWESENGTLGRGINVCSDAVDSWPFLEKLAEKYELTDWFWDNYD